jgi:hypothetical protein
MIDQMAKTGSISSRKSGENGGAIPTTDVSGSTVVDILKNDRSA